MTKQRATPGGRTATDTAERALGLLGLARRAGKLALGATAVEQLVHRGPPPVVVVARDAGAGQRRRMLALRPVRGHVADLLDRQQLAARLGRNELAVVAVADPGFVRGLQELGVVRDPREDSATS
jgi:ribosomal protein L7Ae-like RNA K-turn-binding protein